jgi:Pyruvate/2-oxoacid:ferredoxin oxidoreductase delta subunit
MAVRDVVDIDEKLCDGCGDCVTACAEGAIEVIDGTARLVSDVYCDGLGACLGHCPQGAITVSRREAEEFDETAVHQRLHTMGRNQAQPHPSSTTVIPVVGSHPGGGCPGSRPAMREVRPPAEATDSPSTSQLRHWPVQLHLVPPTAGFFRDADLLLAADCVAFALADFHRQYLSGRSLAIACPKLDSHQEVYLEKLVAMIDEAKIRSLTVMVMEVPCCGGLARLAEEAVRRAQREVPVEVRVVGTGGQVLGAFPLAG